MIQHISFIHPIEVGGDINSLTYWSRIKHAELIDVAERGPYIIVTVKKTGEFWKVPLSGVNNIKETPDAAKEAKAVK